MANTFPEKFYKKLKGLSFMDDTDSKSEEEIKKEIVSSEERLYNLDKEMEEDVNLQKAKDEVKLLTSAYREVVNIEKAKIKYCLYVMESRGYQLSESEETESEKE